MISGRMSSLGSRTPAGLVKTQGGGRENLPSGVRSCRPGQGEWTGCGASADDFFCQMNSNPEVSGEVLHVLAFLALNPGAAHHTHRDWNTFLPCPRQILPGEYPASTSGRCSWLEGVDAQVQIDFSSLHGCLCNAWACFAMQNLHFAQ